MKIRNILVVFLCVLALLSGCRQNPLAPWHRGRKTSDGQPQITLMTRNIYVGTAIDVAAFQSADLVQLGILVEQAMQLLEETKFPLRAIALAEEIKQARPHLVGLQEVALIELPNESAPIDYLNILLALLPDYYLAGVVNNATLTFPVPAFAGMSLTDRDVVLARKDVVKIGDATAVNYTNMVEFTVLGVPIEFARGFVAVDVEIDGIAYRFVNTHLENANSQIRLKQAQELTAFLQGSALPVFLVGDFNSSAPTGTSYQHILSENFVDLWTRNELSGNPSGHTSPHNSNLQNQTVNLTARIDLIFVRDPLREVGSVQAFVVGDELSDRVPVPFSDVRLWPSDHAGVVTTFAFRED